MIVEADYSQLEWDIVDRFAAAEGLTRDEMLKQLSDGVRSLYDLGPPADDSRVFADTGRSPTGRVFVRHGTVTGRVTDATRPTEA